VTAGAGPTRAASAIPRREATARAFLALLVEDGRPAASFDEAVDALLDGPRRPSADLAGAAVALGRAVDAVGGVGALPRLGPAILLVSVPAMEWVEPVASASALCLVDPGRRFPRGDGRAGTALIVQADGSSSGHQPDRRNGEVRQALQDGAVVIGVSQDPARLLPGDLVRGAELRIEVEALDPTEVALVVEAVTGAAPRSRLSAAGAALCDPGDLSLAVHAARGGEGSASRLAAIVSAKVGTDRGGPGLEELHGYGAARDWGLSLVLDLRAWLAGGPAAPRWADLESAALLSGPPGVGKTAFAAALARSAGLPLIAGSLAQWQAARDGHLGHTLGAMRAFFDRARRSPCVALVDEIDSFGDRASFPEHSRDYATQVVNALLEHLAGAASREGVVVVGTTNHPGRIDPAILRSGRLERHVRIQPPDAVDLALILRGYLAGALPGLDLRPLAGQMLGATGADAEAVVRRARGVARRAGRDLDAADLAAAAAEAWPPLPASVRRRVAVHEAGHVLAAATIGAGAASLSAAIGAEGGAAWIGAGEGAGPVTEAQLDERLAIMLAGRAAEEAVFGDVTAGAAEDLAAATRLAVAMETHLGFSPRTPLVALPKAATADLLRVPGVAAAVHLRLTAAYGRASGAVRARRAALGRLADALDRQGDIGDAAIRKIIRGSRRRGEPDADR